jgi:hypothetical protein
LTPRAGNPDNAATGFFAKSLAGGDSPGGENPKDFEVHKGFQTSARQTIAERRSDAYLTFWTACGLTLATLIAVATVSIEVVKAAALH